MNRLFFASLLPLALVACSSPGPKPGDIPESADEYWEQISNEHYDADIIEYDPETGLPIRDTED